MSRTARAACGGGQDTSSSRHRRRPRRCTSPRAQLPAADPREQEGERQRVLQHCNSATGTRPLLRRARIVTSRPWSRPRQQWRWGPETACTSPRSCLTGWRRTTGCRSPSRSRSTRSTRNGRSSSIGSMPGSGASICRPDRQDDRSRSTAPRLPRIARGASSVRCARRWGHRGWHLEAHDGPFHSGRPRVSCRSRTRPSGRRWPASGWISPNDSRPVPLDTRLGGELVGDDRREAAHQAGDVEEGGPGAWRRLWR